MEDCSPFDRDWELCHSYLVKSIPSPSEFCGGSLHQLIHLRHYLHRPHKSPGLDRSLDQESLLSPHRHHQEDYHRSQVVSLVYIDSLFRIQLFDPTQSYPCIPKKIDVVGLTLVDSGGDACSSTLHGTSSSITPIPFSEPENEGGWGSLPKIWIMNSEASRHGCWGESGHFTCFTTVRVAVSGSSVLNWFVMVQVALSPGDNWPLHPELGESSSNINQGGFWGTISFTEYCALSLL